MGFLEKIFGNYSDKEIKKILPIVKKINSLEPEFQKLTDDEMRQKTEEFKKRHLENGESLDSLLPEAFALVREASVRTLGMRPFDVQLIGGIVLHQGRISEMKTGEGKTLVATLPAYLNALSGKGVHIVTVNEYLARRDCEQMGQIYGFLGLTTGVILNGLSTQQRQAAYNCDITYATNNELGFDYLRDNMVTRRESLVQRDLHYAIIDEVDSVLIDEARTPLIISGSGQKSTKLYTVADLFAKSLTRGKILNEEEALNPLLKEELKEEGDFVVDEKAKSVTLTQQGVAKAEKYFGLENLSDPENLEIQHHINNALKANYDMALDVDYVVKDNEILIVDEFTGRIMPGRRYSDGLHQALEAKEGVDVKKESKTFATITFQNFFNKYYKKSGMTGTAHTDEAEFRNIYNLDVVCIPTNKPVIRIDHDDVVYLTEKAKFRAVVKEVAESHAKGQPVLVGTVTIEKSELLSSLLKKEGIPHTVLNAKYHEKEAEIVALAGERGAVTIATNMAGRGTDIKLGEGVPELGGLKIIGTERHESRRIDNQLRGRSGRQGDPGESRFYLSMEDDLLRIFGSERTMTLIQKLNVPEDEPIEHSILTKTIENSQKKVEGNNFAVRKRLLDYDKVMNDQREVIYAERRRVLFGENLRDSIVNMATAVSERIVRKYLSEEQDPQDWDMLEMCKELNQYYPIGLLKINENDYDKVTVDKMVDLVRQLAVKFYEAKEKEIGDPEKMRQIERYLLLKVVDMKWQDHIDDMERLRQNIMLQAYAQRDPLMEYKFSSYDMFEELTNNIQSETVRLIYHIQLVENEAPKQKEEVEPQNLMTNRTDETAVKEPVKAEKRPGRNDPCPCGSGKKYKHCCGRF